MLMTMNERTRKGTISLPGAFMALLFAALLPVSAFGSHPPEHRHGNRAGSSETGMVTLETFRVGSPAGDDWVANPDRAIDGVNFKKVVKNPGDFPDVSVVSYVQVFKKKAEGEPGKLSRGKTAQAYIDGEEVKVREELVKKESYELKALEKGTTDIGGKPLRFMQYQAVKKPLVVDSVFYVHFTDRFEKDGSFYVFFISEAYIPGRYTPDLAQINPVIESFQQIREGEQPKPTVDDLLNAADGGRVTAIRALIDKGVDVNGKSKSGWTALMASVAKGELRTARLLVDKGADVNIQNNQGQTPLILASHWGYVQMMELLIEHGADMNVQMKNGWTALMIAVQMKRVEAVKFLLRSGADVNLKSADGMTALGVAEKIGNAELKGLLSEAGAGKK